MLICLHVGAHRTACRFIQDKLAAQSKRLRRGGVDQVAPVNVRKHLADRLDAGGGTAGDGRDAIARALEKLIAYRAGRDRTIMSDENIAGPMACAFDPRGLYPEIGNRLAAVVGGVPKRHDVQVLFAIRGYAEFFSSAYAHRTGERSAEDFEARRDSALSQSRGWREVVADICEIVGAGRTVIWTYESFALDPEPAGRAFAGEWNRRVFCDWEATGRATLSRKGLAVLDRASGLLSEREYAALARALPHYAFQEPDGPFSLFDAAERKELDRRYAADVAAIGALGCQLIAQPPGDASLSARPVEAMLAQPRT